MSTLVLFFSLLCISTLVQGQLNPYPCTDTIYHVHKDIKLSINQKKLYNIESRNANNYKCLVRDANSSSIWLRSSHFHLSTFVQTGDYRAKKAGEIYYDSLSEKSQYEKDSIAFYYLDEIHQYQLPHLFSFNQGKLGGKYPYVDGYYASSSKKKNDEYDEYIYKKGRKYHHAHIERLVLIDTIVCSFSFGTRRAYRRCQKKKMYRETKKYFDAFVSGIIFKKKEED